MEEERTGERGMEEGEGRQKVAAHLPPHHRVVKVALKVQTVERERIPSGLPGIPELAPRTKPPPARAD